MFNFFQSDVSKIDLPDKFTFPFYYEPHPIAIAAVQELQEHIEKKAKWKHNFGLAGEEGKGEPAIGKMFGVLVVKTQNGGLGYLAAFSGKLGDSNHHDKFVPPVYDMLKKGDYFEQEGQEIIKINKAIEALEIDPNFIQLNDNYELLKHQVELEEEKERETLSEAKKQRRTERNELLEKGFAKESKEYVALHAKHKEESLKHQYDFKQSQLKRSRSLEALSSELAPIKKKILGLKEERKERSNTLQNKLFGDYTFLNIEGKSKSLLHIFQDTILGRPPAGAGECAAPKLLQFAFKNSLHPIALAEFWWGAPPSAEVKKHKHFYPACKGKCEPILGHMLDGLAIDPDPIQINYGEGREIKILHEEENFVVINKPSELLSVPGKQITDSVYTRIKKMYPKSSGPLIVHRLDMSTSGIMILALNDRAYKGLQKQFIKRTAKKRYTAVLNGFIEEAKGTIELPLSLDFLDRPKQMVDRENGKQALTKYETMKVEGGKTRVSFYPLTGRTHQLRVHAAHQDGLNCPIVGDDLYGEKADRLHLHAEELIIKHPLSHEEMKFICEAPF